MDFAILCDTADVLTVIIYIISDVLDKLITRATDIDISKAFYKVWHGGLLNKLSSIWISFINYNVIPKK